MVQLSPLLLLVSAFSCTDANSNILREEVGSVFMCILSVKQSGCHRVCLVCFFLCVSAHCSVCNILPVCRACARVLMPSYKRERKRGGGKVLCSIKGTVTWRQSPQLACVYACVRVCVYVCVSWFLHNILAFDPPEGQCCIPPDAH